MHRFGGSTHTKLMVAMAVAAGLALVGNASGQKKTTSTPAPKPAPAKTTTTATKTATTGAAGGARPGAAPAHVDLTHAAPGKYAMPGGKTAVVRPDGSRIISGRDGRPVEMHRPGMDAHYGPGGRVDSLRLERPGGYVQMVHRGPGGVRIAEGFHPAIGGAKVHVVSYGAHRGFVERGIYGRPGYMRRSYMVGDRRYAVVYRGYHYRGFAYYRPVPMVIYSPAYYGWAVRPWGAPVAIQVGFAQQPWYGAYPGAFQPYPVYASPDQWMTDQILAQNMQAAYDAGRESVPGPDAASYAAAAPPPITPELKQQFNAQVAQEVQEQQQIAAAGPNALAPPETASDPDETPEALKPGHTIFRVVSTLTADADGEQCLLNSDDWVTRNGDVQNGLVSVTVAASRPTDCAQGTTAQIALNDLMTMQNEMDQQVLTALQMASASMGKGGMPSGPPAGAIPVPGGQTQPDMDVVASLQKEQGDATAAEQQAAPPTTVQQQ